MKIIKYHYVRDFTEKKSLHLKGLDYRKFDYQLNYLQSNFNILDPLTAHKKILLKDFDPYDCWLTFDDGYTDHYKFVYPILKKYNVYATFYPTIAPLLSNRLLKVNKIHYILASTKNKNDIYNRIKFYYKEFY